MRESKGKGDLTSRDTNEEVEVQLRGCHVQFSTKTMETKKEDDGKRLPRLGFDEERLQDHDPSMEDKERKKRKERRRLEGVLVVQHSGGQGLGLTFT